MKYILSRAFVEFGPFETAEILDFGRRNLIRPGDYLRAEGDHHWDDWDRWLHQHSDGPIAAVPKKAVPAKKKAPAAKKTAPAKKKAPAKKAPAKKSAPPKA